MRTFFFYTSQGLLGVPLRPKDLVWWSGQVNGRETSCIGNAVMPPGRAFATRHPAHIPLRAQTCRSIAHADSREGSHVSRAITIRSDKKFWRANESKCRGS
jgi:hypothetical protein